MIVFNALQTSLNGGIGRYSYELAKNLYISSDIDVKLVIREEDLDKYKFAEKNDLIIAKNIKNSKQRNIYEQFKLPFIVKKLYPNAILHYPDSMAPLLASNRVAITVHDIAFRSMKDIFTWKSKLWKNIMTFLSVKKAEKVFAISEFTKKEIKEAYGEKVINKTTVVLNGFNDFSLEDIDMKNVRKDILDLKNEKYILTVSTISPRKNIDGLIKAYNNCKCKEELKLVVAGGNGWMYEDVYKVAEELKLNDNIIFTGRINDEELKYLYKNSNIFAYVSFYEGFGLPPVEAMSYGVPCVVANVTSLPEVVGDACLKVDPKNDNEITNAFDLLASNGNLINKYSELGKLNVKRFSWEKCANEMISIYKS